MTHDNSRFPTFWGYAVVPQSLSWRNIVMFPMRRSGEISRSRQRTALWRNFMAASGCRRREPEPPFDRRSREQVDAKSRIGVRAASYIREGATILLDNSTTACFLARELASGADDHPDDFS